MCERRKRRFKLVEEVCGEKYYFGIFTLPYLILFLIFLTMGILGFILPFILHTPVIIDLTSLGLGIVGLLATLITGLMTVNRREFREFVKEFRDFTNEMREFRTEMRRFTDEMREFRRENTQLLREILETLREIRDRITVGQRGTGA